MDYSSVIRLRDLDEMIDDAFLSLEEFCSEVGITTRAYRYYQRGGSLPSTQTIASIAGVLGIGIEDVVEFLDIETGDYFKDKEVFKNRIVIKNPVVTYAPLRVLIYDFYKDKRPRKTIKDFFDAVPKREPQEYQLKNAENLKQWISKNKQLGDSGYHRQGLRQPVRHKIMNDESTDIRYIYDFCKMLKCPVDFVMGVKSADE